MLTILAAVGLILISAFSFAEEGDKATTESTIKLATTTSTDNSGLLDYLLPVFTEDTNIKVNVIAVGTGKALALGRNGDVDVVLVHARPSEDKYMEGGFGTIRKDVMYNDFVIIGPKEDPAGIKGLSVSEALKKISSTKAPFISRGDDSGTNKKEKILWSNAGITPTGKWYNEAGQGMGAVLIMTNEVSGYTITDRGTFIAYTADGKISLEVLVAGDDVLFNPYGIMDVSPKLHPAVKHEDAVKLIDWLTSEKGQKLIGDFRLKDKVLFYPNAGK